MICFRELVGFFGHVFAFVQTGVLLLVKQQISWASNTSDSDTVPASNILARVGLVYNVSREIMAFMGALVRAFEGGSWFPCLSCNAFFLVRVQALITFSTVDQACRPACLAVGKSVDALDEIVWVTVYRVVSISFSMTQFIRTFDSFWSWASVWVIGMYLTESN